MSLRRIGEMSRRLGVSPELLRAWERRYGVIEPLRTESGYRLYSERDEQRVREMLRLVRTGVSPQQAAQTVRRAVPSAEADGGRVASDDAERAALADALERFDEPAAQAAIDRLLATFSVEAVLGQVVLPILAGLGERWASGAGTVAQEHFASHVIRGRLLGLARGWDAGSGPRAVLACPPGELHDLGLIAFGLALRAQGWRITLLGANTPAESMDEAVERLDPDVLVLSATVPERLAGLGGPPRGRRVRLAVGGRGATAENAERLGAVLLDGDVFAAADRLTAVVHAA